MDMAGSCLIELEGVDAVEVVEELAAVMLSREGREGLRRVGEDRTRWATMVVAVRGWLRAGEGGEVKAEGVGGVVDRFG